MKDIVYLMLTILWKESYVWTERSKPVKKKVFSESITKHIKGTLCFIIGFNEKDGSDRQ